MDHRSTRWITVTDSPHPRERAALDHIRAHLPDHPPFLAMSNFEFIAGDGSINEIDLLVVGLQRIFVVEIKSWRGEISGDAGTWTRRLDARQWEEDNPLLLTNRKAKKLRALLQKTGACKAFALPFLEPLVFLSEGDVVCKLAPHARQGVCLGEAAGAAGFPTIVQVLTGADPGVARRLSGKESGAIARALREIGVRPSRAARRVADYYLQELLAETDQYQDWRAERVDSASVQRRVRLYPYALAASREARRQQQQAARAEYLLLEGIQHPGVERALDLVEHERGPALLFEYHPEALRLDSWLERHLARLDRGERLALLRQLAETLRFLHARRIYHRALSPASVWVLPPEEGAARLRIGDWQHALGGARETTSSHGDEPFHGIEQDPARLLYLAPEALASQAADPARLDTFALGAIAYRLFTGQPPAPSPQALERKLADGQGLAVSEVLDGAVERLDLLIQSATSPRPEYRLDLDEFLDYLQEVEEELTEPEENRLNPLDARAGDRLPGGFVVQRRLGKGGTALALLVRRDGVDSVLKIALKPDYHERLRAEGAALAGIRHPNIVACRRVLELNGHLALELALAGPQTLGQRLRQEGRLSLDLLQRFGEELLETLKYLEENGIPHRDIKPDNIGIGETPGKKLTLVLFDFSLTNAPAEAIRVGTPAYLDPFLKTRKPPRWDYHAERFAAAVTLHEMTTGTLPGWGDGASDPALLDEEVALDSELFDAMVRDALLGFFQRALARDHRVRFDNAEEMLKAWRRVFEHLDRPVTLSEDGDWDPRAALVGARLDSPLSGLGLTPRMLDALGRMGAQTVGELLALPRIRLYRLKGVGQRTVRAIRELSEQLAAQLAVGEPAPALEADAGDGDEAGQWPVPSVDQLLKRLTGLQLATPERAVLEAFLGLNETCPPWCGQQEVAEALGVSRADVQQVLERARSRWQRQGWMSALRRQLSQVLQRHGGLMLLDEVADTLVALRGSLAEGAERRRRARALATAAIETEAATAQTAWVLYRGPHRSLLVATGALLAGQPATPPPARANFVERLGARADELAGMDPLLSPVRVLEQLRAVAAPEHDPPLAPERLLALAVGMAREAALSSRQELYPRAMAAERALKLGGGSLFGARHLNAQAVRQRIQSRYPEAEPLPGRPALDRLLEQAGVDLLWEAGADEGRGAYVPVRAGPGGSSSSFHRLPTGGRLTDLGPAVEAAARLETRLQRALAERRFLVLLVAPRHLLRVEAEIAARFPVAVRSLEALLLASMRTVAAERGARWAVVSEADGRDRHGNDWRRLRQLVGLALPAVEQALRESGQPVLLNYLGMLARYDRLDLLERFREAGARGEGPGLIALVAADEQSHLPMLDGRAIPVIQPAEWARVPESWVENEHRGGRGGG